MCVCLCSSDSQSLLPSRSLDISHNLSLCANPDLARLPLLLIIAAVLAKSVWHGRKVADALINVSEMFPRAMGILWAQPVYSRTSCARSLAVCAC